MRRLGPLAVVVGVLASLTVAAPGPAQAAVASFSYTGAPIAIGDLGTVVAAVNVKDIGSTITDLNVEVTGLSHASPSDLDIWLVAPNEPRAAVALMSDDCSSNALSGVDLTFDDEATGYLPPSGCGTGTYRPRNQSLGGDTIPAQARTLGATLAAFDGTNPNGTWYLYATDDSSSDTGTLAGVTITMSTAPAAVVINDANGASPYPFTITVKNQPGRITDVDLALVGLSHGFLGDVDAVLVNPAGKTVVLASDACLSGPPDSTTLRFDDSATKALPQNDSCPSGSYRPADYGTPESLPSPAPAGPYGTTLSALKGTSANGTWKLYVADDDPGASGYIKSVTLTLKTDARPDTIITSKPPKTTKSTTATVAFRSTKGGSTFQCKVDSKAWKSCTSPFKVTKVTKGTHTVLVRAVDNSGKADKTPAKVTWKRR